MIPVNEQEIMRISLEQEKFKEHDIKVVINDSNIIRTFLDKMSTFEYLRNIEGISVPKTYSFGNFQEDGENYIIKLRNSCGSKFLKIVRTREEIIKLNLHEQDYVIQEYLKEEDEEYTMGVFSNGEKTATILFKRKLKNGYSSFVELTDLEEMDCIAKKIAKRIDLHGYINIQFRKDGKAYKIFEINPRISGTVYFRHMLGFKDVLWWLDMLDGEKDFFYEKKFSRAIGVRELSEKFLVLE